MRRAAFTSQVNRLQDSLGRKRERGSTELFSPFSHLSPGFLSTADEVLSHESIADLHADARCVMVYRVNR